MNAKKNKRPGPVQFHKAASQADAARWDIDQQVQMSPIERQRIAKELKRRFYGADAPDVRGRRR